MKIFIVLILLGAIYFTANGQCKGFAKQICKLELKGQANDCNFIAAMLYEGEEAEVYKTVFAGQHYRITISGSGTLPAIEYQVIDARKNVLYDNRNNDLKASWDFNPESNQQLKIVLKVPGSDKPEELKSSGCVAIIIAY